MLHTSLATGGRSESPSTGEARRRTWIAIAAGALAAHGALAQTVSSSNRSVQSNTTVQSTTATGPWTASVGGGQGSQTSDVFGTGLTASGQAFASWPGPNNSSSKITVVFELTTGKDYTLSGDVTGYIMGIPGYEPGTCSVTLSGPSGIVAQATAPTTPPYFVTVPYFFSGYLPAGSYTLSIDAEATAFGSFMQHWSGDAEYHATLGFTTLCLSPGAQSCFLAHATPSCNDATCCDQICGNDPFCCQTSWDSICQSEALTSCSPGFVTDEVIDPWNGHKHRLLSTASWTAASSAFFDAGTNFVTVRNGRENEWLRQSLLNNVSGWSAGPGYIGLSDAAVEGNFVWTSGQPLTFTNWAPGEPNNGGGNEDSVELFNVDGRWNDVSTAVELPAISDAWRTQCGGASGPCEAVHGPGCADETCCNVVCDADPFCCVTQWDGICVNEAVEWCSPHVVAGPIVNPQTKHRYYLLSTSPWVTAERQAMLLGGHLATLGTAAENQWVAINFGQNLGASSYFIGLEDQAVEGSFRWVSGEPLGFTQWETGQPSGVSGEDAVTSSALGFWADVPLAAVVQSVVEAPCLGDVNNDGAVNGADLAGMLGAWGTHDPKFDFNVDGNVDAADLGVLLGAWGSCPSSNACFAHAGPGSDQPGCTQCVCGIDPFCCATQWDSLCVTEAGVQCNAACQCNP